MLFNFHRESASSEPFVSENGSMSEWQVTSQAGSDAVSPDKATHETHGHTPSDSPTPSQPPNSPSFTSHFLSFREPSKNIKQLRQLAIQGREETLREEAEGREKVVWGTVDGWRDAQVRREEGDGPASPALSDGTLPNAGDQPEASEGDGVVVSADGSNESGNGGEMADPSR